MTFLADDRNGSSVYLNAPSWTVAEEMAAREGYHLVGEYLGSQDCGFPTDGDTIQ